MLIDHGRKMHRGAMRSTLDLTYGWIMLCAGLRQEIPCALSHNISCVKLLPQPAHSWTIVNLNETQGPLPA